MKNLGILIKKNSLLFLSIGFMLINLIAENSHASSYGLQVSYGTGKPDHLKGYRVAVQQFWPWIGFAESRMNLTGYWDLSYAHWQVVPPLTNQPHSIGIIAISPVIRLQSRENWLLASQAYLELGVGASWLSNHHLGHRNLGSPFAFQDLMGLGLRWRKNPTALWSLSYHYLHYSNASLFPPNQGIDVKHLLTLGYEF